MRLVPMMKGWIFDTYLPLSCILGPRPWLVVYFLLTGTTSMILVPMMKGWIFDTYLLLSCILGPGPWLEGCFIRQGLLL